MRECVCVYVCVCVYKFIYLKCFDGTFEIENGASRDASEKLVIYSLFDR